MTHLPDPGAGSPPPPPPPQGAAAAPPSPAQQSAASAEVQQQQHLSDLCQLSSPVPAQEPWRLRRRSPCSDLCQLSSLLLPPTRIKPHGIAGNGGTGQSLAAGAARQPAGATTHKRAHRVWVCVGGGGGAATWAPAGSGSRVCSTWSRRGAFSSRACTCTAAPAPNKRRQRQQGWQQRQRRRWRQERGQWEEPAAWQGLGGSHCRCSVQAGVHSGRLHCRHHPLPLQCPQVLVESREGHPGEAQQDARLALGGQARQLALQVATDLRPGRQATQMQVVGCWSCPRHGRLGAAWGVWVQHGARGGAAACPGAQL